MLKQSLISVIVLNWNGKHHLDECLNSLLSQSYKNFEVILVDNGSTDGSKEYVESIYSSVRLISLEQNYGFCRGNNIGIKSANGEYIILLNNDTVVERDWLGNLYECIISEPAVGFCASKMVTYFNKDFIDSAGDGFSICGAGYKRGHLERLEKYRQDEYVFGASAGAAIYKKEMLDRIGLLDEDFFAIYEDVDISFRAQLAGYKCKFASNAVVYHKVNATLGKLSDFYVYHGQRNAEYVYFKNMPSSLISATVLHHIAYNFLAFLYFALKGKGMIFLKAKIDFLRNLKNVLEKRREVQSLKCVDSKYLLSMFEKKWLSFGYSSLTALGQGKITIL